MFPADKNFGSVIWSSWKHSERGLDRDGISIDLMLKQMDWFSPSVEQEFCWIWRFMLCEWMSPFPNEFNVRAAAVWSRKRTIIIMTKEIWLNFNPHDEREYTMVENILMMNKEIWLNFNPHGDDPEYNDVLSRSTWCSSVNLTTFGLKLTNLSICQ